MMEPLPVAYERYQQLQRYVGWTDEDARRVQSIGPLVTPYFGQLVDDFYAEIQNHPEARSVITGGEEQISRLKKTLRTWLEELFSGHYDRDYVERRWRVGNRHVEIGLLQVYTNAALCRLRRGLLAVLEVESEGGIKELLALRESLNILIDLDLAIIEDAYQTEFQRRQALAERQASEERYRSLFENTLDGLLIVDDQGTIVAANHAARIQFAQAVGTLENKSINIFTIAAEGGSRAAVWTDFFDHDKNTGEITLLRPNATSVDIEYRSVTNIAPGVNLLSIRDITTRKRAEERALQSERLAAIGETMAGLVHESRNALQRSRASLEMLSLEIEDRPEALKLVARVQKAQEDLHRLFEEVRQWAAPLHLQREECSLREIWMEVWCHVKQAHPPQAAQLEEHLECDPACRVDRFAMTQVFRNIFENALEASPSGGRVTIRCWSSSNSNGPEVSVAISDQGPGLTAEQQKRIFEPFFTTKAKGTGLGMAIAQRIVQSHGETIAVSSPGSAQNQITLPNGAA